MLLLLCFSAHSLLNIEVAISIYRGSNAQYDHMFSKNAGKSILKIFGEVQEFENQNSSYKINPELGVPTSMVDDCSKSFMLKKTRLKGSFLEYLYRSPKWAQWMFNVRIGHEVIPFLLFKCSLSAPGSALALSACSLRAA